MSRRTASSAGTVSLFPFLAVLVCAMGALILLLLVTTRRIRQRTIADESVVQSIESPGSASTPIIVKSVAPPTARQPDLATVPILPLLASEPQVLPHDPTPALLKRLALLEAEQSALADEVDQRTQQLAQLEAAMASQSEQLQRQMTTADAQAAEKERMNNLYVRLRDQQKQTNERVDELRQRIQRARTQLANADSKFAVIPYDGHSGTTRRPIIIECTADQLTFASEGISLSARDLDGFSPRYNPLLYATQALIRYWERQDRMSAGDEVGEPYVLLVVRPGGTVAYYKALMLLAGLGEPFGYELVTDDQQFAWPARDLEAVVICRTIIDKFLAEQPQRINLVLQHGAILEDLSDEQGRFHLDEIDRLRNPIREVTINGQRFSRSPGRAEGLSRYANGNYGSPSRSGGSTPDTDTGQSSARSVYTRQNSAVTQADRMPEWLREGTTRPSAPDQQGSPIADSTTELHSPNQSPGSTSASSETRHVEVPSTGGDGSLFDPSAAEDGSPQLSPPPQRLNLTPDPTRGRAPIDESRPQWGPRTGNGLIGFEKQVRIEVSASQITIADSDAFQCDRATSSSDLQRLLAGAINRRVRSWGSPPKSFYWVPAIRFAVTPDGRAQHERLRSILKDWELQSSVEYLAQ